ncbi:MAG: hypothetical protein Q7S10_02435 [bacterium]|nr:hypothetical protein [bacterium]
MKLPVAQSFFRPPYHEKDPVEDGFFINSAARLYGVADGVSEAYSPSNPCAKYYGEFTGGQIAARSFCLAGCSAQPTSAVEQFAVDANGRVLGSHLHHGKDPNGGDDVGGASFAACKLGPA